MLIVVLMELEVMEEVLGNIRVLQHTHQRVFVPDEGLEYGVQVLILVPCSLENTPGGMGPVHEYKFEVGQRSDQGMIDVVGIAPQARGHGPQQFTRQLLVRGAIGDEHLSYGSHMGPELPVQFGWDTYRENGTTSAPARGKATEAFPGC